MSLKRSLRPQKATGFDFSTHMRSVCEDMIIRLPELAHIDLELVTVVFAQARKSVMHGLQASLTPLRFEGGSRTGVQHGRRMTIQRVYDRNGLEMLYILTFYMPRFMNLDPREKLVTILHELWHISPDFDGDIRRHPGRCYAHSHSAAEYDAHMEVLVDRWLEQSPPRELYSFLELSFSELQARYGGVFGMRLPRPRLLPCSDG